jgi:Icc-related predicted phosphoesterase
MRIAAVSDIHGNIWALEAVLADAKDAGADLVVNCGDILSGPLEPSATADLLASLSLPRSAETASDSFSHAPGTFRATFCPGR